MNIKKRVHYIPTIISYEFIKFYFQNRTTKLADALTYIKLRKETRSFVNNYSIPQEELNNEDSNIIWICWFQGYDTAPQLVKHNISKMKKLLPDKNIKIISFENLHNYISFPDYLEEKINNGQISMAHLSDIVRVTLLSKYGGTWIDSTVYFTSDKYPKYIFDSPLFFYSNLEQNNAAIIGSSWFIHSDVGNPIIVLTRDLLFNYWKNHDEMDNYFMFHIFFTIACQHFEKDYQNVHKLTNVAPHELGKVMFDTFDQNKFEEISKNSSLHKLTNKFNKDDENKKDTYYQYILNN